MYCRQLVKRRRGGFLPVELYMHEVLWCSQGQNNNGHLSHDLKAPFVNKSFDEKKSKVIFNFTSLLLGRSSLAASPSPCAATLPLLSVVQ
jgi:hypothetical protein